MKFFKKYNINAVISITNENYKYTENEEIKYHLKLEANDSPV